MRRSSVLRGQKHTRSAVLSPLESTALYRDPFYIDSPITESRNEDGDLIVGGYASTPVVDGKESASSKSRKGEHRV